MRQPVFSFNSVFFVCCISENKRNTPKTRQSNEDIDYSADNSCLSAEDPCNDIKLEKTDTAPVESTYDRQNQRYFIQYYHGLDYCFLSSSESTSVLITKRMLSLYFLQLMKKINIQYLHKINSPIHNNVNEVK